MLSKTRKRLIFWLGWAIVAACLAGFVVLAVAIAKAFARTVLEIP